MTAEITPIKRPEAAPDAPALWPAHYAPPDIAAIERIQAWLAAGGGVARSQSRLARASGVAASTLSQVLSGAYVASPSGWLRMVLGRLDREAERELAVSLPYTDTSVAALVRDVCHRAHRFCDVGIISGEVGIGKTSALKQYAAENPNVVLIEASPEMGAAVLLRALAAAVGATVQKANRYAGATKTETFSAVLERLRGSDKLLVIDEADKVLDSCLEYARRLSDIAGIGLVLAGTERLRPMVEAAHGRHGQISSRVGYWPPVVRGITRQDSDLLVRAALAQRVSAEELEEDVLDAYWQMCDGRARVLAKLLRLSMEVRGSGGELSQRLVIRAGQQLMGLKAGSRPEIYGRGTKAAAGVAA